MDKKYLFKLSGVLTLFIALILILCHYFRISTDDYTYIAEVERTGVIKIVSDSYLYWSGRFAAFAVLSTIFKIFRTHPSYFFLVPLCTFIVMLWGIYKLIGTVLQHYFIGFNNLKKWVLSLSFLSLLFFLSIDIGETWFWCSSMAGYLFCIVAFVWGLHFIIQPSGNLYCYLGIIACFTFIGGASEIYSPIFLLIFLWILLSSFKQFCHSKPAADNKINLFRQFIKKNNQHKLFVAFMSLGLSFLILIIAPGNYLRDQLFPDHRFFFSFFITAKSFVKFFILYIPLHLHIILAFCTIFVFVGDEFREKNVIQFNLNFLTFLKKITSFLVFLLAIFFFMVAYIMSETGPARIWFLATILFAVYCCVIFFYAGYCGLFSAKKQRFLKTLSLLTMTVTLSYSLISQTIIASTYAAKYDEREQQLLKWKEEIHTDTLLYVPALPKPGMLYSAEISTDSNHYTNQHLRTFYKLPYQVCRKLSFDGH